MVDERTTNVEDSDVEDVNKVEVDVDRSTEEREVEVQTGGLDVDIEKKPDDEAEEQRPA
jgi:hypothetical protein